MNYTYKQYRNMDGTVSDSGIIRIPDNAAIPADQDNTDYQQYLAWVAQGNVAEPADEGTA